VSRFVLVQMLPESQFGPIIRHMLKRPVVKFSITSILKFVRSRCESKVAGLSNEGFVLIAVIWIAGLLAVAATAFVANTTAQIFLARNVSEGMRLEGTASGVAKLIGYRLALSQSQAGVSGQWLTCDWNKDIKVLFRIQDQGGLVDLNTSSPDLLMALLNGLTRDPQLSRTIFRAIQDYKDPDSLAFDGGAEQSLYAGKAYGPKNAPFETPLELDQIPEISDAMFLKIQDYVTVQSQQFGIDLSVAPDVLKETLKLGLQGGADLQLFSQPSPSRIFAIDAIAHLKNGGIFQRRVLVNVLRQPERPFAVLEWRRASTVQKPLPGSKPTGHCVSG
jgi:general secretion pathway protein K